MHQPVVQSIDEVASSYRVRFLVALVEVSVVLIIQMFPSHLE